MKILVCVKQVIDSNKSLEIDPASGDVRQQGVAWMANPADLAAVRMAASIAAQGAGAEIIALSVGPERVETVLRKSLALGADRAVRIEPGPAQPGTVKPVFPLIAAAARHLDCALVLCGNQAVDTLSGQTGIALSVALDWPLLTSVTQVRDVQSKEALVLQRRADIGRQEVVQLAAPAVLTCEPDENELPYPSLPAHMRSLAAPIELLTPQQIGAAAPEPVSAAMLKLGPVAPPKPRPKQVFTPDSSLSAADRMKQILSGGLSKRQSNILEGKARDVAISLVNELDKRQLI